MDLTLPRSVPFKLVQLGYLDFHVSVHLLRDASCGTLLGTIAGGRLFFAIGQSVEDWESTVRHIYHSEYTVVMITKH